MTPVMSPWMKGMVALLPTPIPLRTGATLAPPMVPRADASEAMARYARGDDAAFAEVYDALSPRLHAYLRRYVRSDSAADDLLQQTFLKMHLNRSRFAPGAKVEPWAFAIARGVAIDQLRAGKRRATEGLPEELPETDGVDASAPAALGELRDALAAELSTMSPKLREAFLLVRMDGLSHAEAAEVLGIEETATKVRAHRATSWLRERLGRFLGGEEPQ